MKTENEFLREVITKIDTYKCHKLNKTPTNHTRLKEFIMDRIMKITKDHEEYCQEIQSDFKRKNGSDQIHQESDAKRQNPLYK